ncbi:MAG: DOMON-like domain-containing protein [Bradyrhizobium sp.]
MKVELSLHPDCKPGSIADLSVEVAHDGNAWRLSYIVTGRISHLVLPEPADPRRAEDLWQTTCFEAFIRHATGDAYGEFNFSPSRAWAAYHFDSHRSGMREIELPKDPEIRIERSEGLLTLEAALTVTKEFTGDDLRLNLAAVIEEKDGTKSYWAVAHPPGEPDFHHPNCFVAPLP